MNVSVSHLLPREDTDTTTIIRIEIEKRDINTKYRKTNKIVLLGRGLETQLQTQLSYFFHKYRNAENTKRKLQTQTPF